MGRQVNRGTEPLFPYLHISGRYHGPAQEDRTDEGIGPQAPKAKEKSEAPGEGSERESQIGKNGGGREGLPFPGFEVAQRVEPARSKDDSLVKSRKCPRIVIPVNPGSGPAPDLIRGPEQAPESRDFNALRQHWTPVFTGVTTFYEVVKDGIVQMFLSYCRELWAVPQ